MNDAVNEMLRREAEVWRRSIALMDAAGAWAGPEEREEVLDHVQVLEAVVAAREALALTVEEICS